MTPSPSDSESPEPPAVAPGLLHGLLAFRLDSDPPLPAMLALPELPEPHSGALVDSRLDFPQALRLQPFKNSVFLGAPAHPDPTGQAALQWVRVREIHNQ